MVSNIGNSTEESIQQMMAQMLQTMGAADTDGVKGLSKDELSSIDAKGDSGGSAFLKSLSAQFDSLDSDKNGQLSVSEIASANPLEGPMGPPPGMSIDSGDVDFADFFGAVEAKKEPSAAEKLTSAESANSASAETDLEALAEQMIKSLMESFSESFSKDSESESDKAEIAKAVNAVAAVADSNGDGAVSLDELTSLDSSKMSDLTNTLASSFKTLDKNSDGSLSIDEMKAALEKPDKQFSTQELALLKDKASDLGSFLGSKSASFVQKLLSNYQGADVSNLASSLSLAL